MSEKEREVSIANEIWIADNCLLWPPKNLIRLPQRKLLNSVPDENWSKIKEFTILKRGLESIKEANECLNYYCTYENTLDKIEEDAARSQRRLHPVQYIENHLDYNSLFDDLNKKKGSTSTPNVSLEVKVFKKQKNTKSKEPCGLCGSPTGIIKCVSCKPDVFCGSCDNLFHKHPLRNDHLREKIENSSSEHNRQDQTKKITSKKSSTVTKSVNAEESVQTEPIYNNNAQVLPIPALPSMKKHLKTADPSTAPGSSTFIKRKINDNEGFESDDIILKRERELQTLSGYSNNIPENTVAGTVKKQDKVIPKKHTINKSGAVRSAKALVLSPSAVPDTSDDNKATTIPTKHALNKPGAKRSENAVSLDTSPPEAPATNKAKVIPTKHALNTPGAKRSANAVSLDSSPPEEPATNKAKIIPKIHTPNKDSAVQLGSSHNKITNKIETLEIKMICVMCGSEGQIQCEECSSMILCVTCDNRFHRHMLRNQHKRQLIQVQRKTETNLIPETEPKAIASTGSHSSIAAPSNHVDRPPPPLILMVRNSTVSEINDSSRADDEYNSDLNQNPGSNEKLNESSEFSFGDNLHTSELNQELEQEQLDVTPDFPLENDHVASDLESQSNEIVDLGETSETKTKTSTSKIQNKGENARKQRNIKRRGITIAKTRNPFNNQMFLKMFVAIKAIKKNQGIMMVAINDLRRQHTAIRNKISQANSEIQVIKELINNNYQRPKNEITVDKTFVVPQLKIGSVPSIEALEKNCRNSAYCDQLAVRFMKYTATNISGIKPVIKRIMEILFTYELIMQYSWTGKSDINSGTNQKRKFSTLTGIQSMITKAATLKLPSSQTIEDLCTKGIKDVVRRASQNWNRQNR